MQMDFAIMRNPTGLIALSQDNFVAAVVTVPVILTDTDTATDTIYD
jgi:hypothetical protein